MAKITSDQKKQIALLTRRANRRIERASEGQRRYLERYIRRMTGGSKFSAKYAGMNEAQAQYKIEQLEKFLSHELTTTKRGWKELTRSNVAAANATFSKRGYNLTDQELADILMQIDTDNKIEYYRVVNVVYARKNQMGDQWTGELDQIRSAIESKISAKAAAKMAIKIRGSQK